MDKFRVDNAPSMGRDVFVALRMTVDGYRGMAESILWLAKKENRNWENAELVLSTVDDRLKSFGTFALISGVALTFLFGWHWWIIIAMLAVMFGAEAIFMRALMYANVTVLEDVS